MDEIQTADKQHVVFGEGIIREWGGCEMPAMIYYVPTVQVRAYWEHSWLIRPTGIGLPLEQHAQANAYPSILGELIHCDWEKHAEENNIGVESDDYSEDLMVPGPDGRFFSIGKLREMCADGCITCGQQLNDRDESITKAITVNEGRDILCHKCVDDLRKNKTTH